MKQILNFLSYTGAYTGICASGYYYCYTKVLITDYSTKRLIFIFLATWFSYLLVDLGPYIRSELTPISSKSEWIVRHKTFLLILLLILIIVTGFNALLLPSKDMLYFIHLGLFVFLYNGAIPIPGLVKLRQIPFLKPFVISYIWVGSSYLLIAKDFHIGALMFIESFCYVFALCLLFDNRDKNRDIKTHTKTFSTQLSQGTDKIIAGVSMLISFIILNYYCYMYINYYMMAAIAVSFVLLVHYSKADRHYYFYLFGVDSLLALKFLMFAPGTLQ